MELLVAGLVLFLGLHSMSIFARGLRNQWVERFGAGPFKAVYAVLAIIGLGLIVHGYGEARSTPILVYAPPKGLRHAALLLMAPVFPLLIATYVPSKTGAKLKHPMLVAVKTWATAHLLANGYASDLLLFGGFLAWAVVDRISLKKRNARTAPTGPARNDAIVWVTGLALYAATLLFLHRWLFGVSPIPGFGF